MNALVVYVHPTRESLNGAILEKVLEGLGDNPRVSDTRVMDLYAEGFDPVLRFGPEKRRRDMADDPAFEVHRKNLEWADLITFVYPVWWGRPPAMLMGFFDQVLALNFAYRYRKNTPFPEGLLKNKKVVCISTAKGPRFYGRLFLGNSHEINLKRAVFNFVGIRRVNFLTFGSMEASNGRQMLHLKQTEEYMRRIAA